MEPTTQAWGQHLVGIEIAVVCLGDILEFGELHYMAAQLGAFFYWSKLSICAALWCCRQKVAATIDTIFSFLTSFFLLSPLLLTCFF